MLDTPEKYQVRSGADINIFTSLATMGQDTFSWHQFWQLLESVYQLLHNASLFIVYTDTWPLHGHRVPNGLNLGSVSFCILIRISTLMCFSRHVVLSGVTFDCHNLGGLRGGTLWNVWECERQLLNQRQLGPLSPVPVLKALCWGNTRGILEEQELRSIHWHCTYQGPWEQSRKEKAAKQ